MFTLIVLLAFSSCVTAAPVGDEEAGKIFNDVYANILKTFNSGDHSAIGQFVSSDAMYTRTLDGETEDFFGKNDVVDYFKREANRGVLNFYFTVKSASREGADQIKAAANLKAFTTSGSESGIIDVLLVKQAEGWVIKEATDVRKPDVVRMN